MFHRTHLTVSVLSRAGRARRSGFISTSFRSITRCWLSFCHLAPRQWLNEYIPVPADVRTTAARAPFSAVHVLVTQCRLPARHLTDHDPTRTYPPDQTMESFQRSGPQQRGCRCPGRLRDSRSSSTPTSRYNIPRLNSRRDGPAIRRRMLRAAALPKVRAVQLERLHSPRVQRAGRLPRPSQHHPGQSKTQHSRVG